MSKPVPGDYVLRCRKCEDKLGRVKTVNPAKYGIAVNVHGAVVRECMGCRQLWLSYVAELPNHRMKIILKMIDKLL